MSNTLLLKRSAVSNSVPTTGQLSLGELAINTYDGKLYTKIDTGTPSIFELTQNQTITLTGNLTGSGTSTINATLSTTGVTGGTYGGSGQIPAFTVDQYGRITAASNVAISTSSISNGTSNVSISVSGGNVTTSVGGTPNVLIVTSTGANVTGYVTATGNVTAPYFIGDVIGNISGNLTLSGFSTGVVFNDAGIANAVSAFTFNKATNAVTAAGNITGANLVSNAGVFGSTLSVTGNANVGNVGGTNAVFTNLTGTLQTAAQPNITSVGTLGSLSVTGNITGGNLNTGGNVNANSAFVNAGAVITSGLMQAGTSILAAGNITGANVISNALLSGTTLSVTGNANVGNVGGTNAVFTNLTGTLTTAAQPNITSVGTLSSLSVSGNVGTGNVSGTLGSFTTVNASGNVLAGNLNSNALVSATTVTATGNVNGGNVVTNKLDGTSVIIASTGDLNLQPTGNIALGNRFVNGVAYPVQNQDAASKLYVDNMVSTGLAYHAAVLVATTDTLANITSGTITYNQPNGAGNGIGATLTTSTSFDLIDTANVQTAGTRILVKDQANAVQNGVYVWSNATVITRSTDTDEYGPNSAEQLSLNDYFFVQSGNVNKGSAYVVDAPTGTITFGTSNITFAQFSSSQTYTANTSAGIVLNGTVFSTKVDNNTTAFDGGGNISVKASANLTTPNIGDATGNSLTLTGNGLVSATTVNATGNVLSGNLNSNAAVTGVTITASGNLVGGNANITSAVNAATVVASGNVTGGNLITSGLLSVTGNANVGNVGGTNAVFTNLTGTLQTAAQPNVTSVGTLNALTVATTILADGYSARTGGDLPIQVLGANANILIQPNGTGITNFNGKPIGNISTVTASGTATVGNVNTAGLISATGNITGGNIISNALVSGTTFTATGNVTGGNANITSATISTSTTTGALIVAGGAGIAGNIYGGDIYKNGVIVLNANDTIDGGTY